VRHAAFFGIALLSAATLHAQPDWQLSGADRIVAIGDIHGAYDAFEGILERARLIDRDGHWTGGTTYLVSVGDVLDRGADSRKALDLIMALGPEAEAQGGRVLMVLGNHEVMNLTGDLRYVSREEYAAFAGEESDAMRDMAFERFRQAMLARGLEAPQRASFDEQYPRGFFAKQRAFAADGKYGSWLLEQPLLLVVDGVAFVHGGMTNVVVRHGVDLNADLGQELEDYVTDLGVLIEAGVLEPTDAFYDHAGLLAAYRESSQFDDAADPVRDAADELDRLQASDLFAPDGPTWYRGNVSCNRLTEQDRLGAALETVGAERLVVGHTPTPDGLILSRMDESLLRVDTGMLKEYYGGRASALIVEGGQLSAIYQDEAGVSAPIPQPRRVGLRPGEMSAADLEAVLSRGTIEVVGDFDSTASLVRIVDGALELMGVFTHAERDNVRPATAAYRLDRLLGLDMVPVTVARETADGVQGSLQYWPPQAIDESQRRAQGLGGQAWCPLADQIRDMTVFDLLIFNEARTAARIRYSTENFQLLLVGHDKTFAPDRGRPDYLENVDVELTPAWRTALAALDEKTLTDALGDVLDRRRIRALLERRDSLLESAQ
jgi:hypothetical protein